LRPGKVLSCATAVSMALQISSDGLLADVVDWYEDVVGLLRVEVHGAQPQARDFQAGTAEMCVLHTLMLLLVTIQVLGVSFVTVGAAGSTLRTCLLRR
jgi:hypothetical protein